MIVGGGGGLRKVSSESADDNIENSEGQLDNVGEVGTKQIRYFDCWRSWR